MLSSKPGPIGVFDSGYGGLTILHGIRPTAEVIGTLTTSRHVGVLATEGTINTESYTLEIQKLWPDITVSGVACPF